MSIPGRDGKSVTSLTTHDSLDKVADWYGARVPTAKRMMLGPNTMLTAKGMMVMVSSDGSETNVLITLGEKD